MWSRLLLPNRFKAIGWYLFVPALISGIFVLATGYEADWLNVPVFAVYNGNYLGKDQIFALIDDNITLEVIAVLFITGGLFIGFSREKREDEFLANLRWSSLVWAVVVNYVLLLLAIVFIYGDVFFRVMQYNMFTVLLIFIARYRFLLYRNSRFAGDGNKILV
ncbi:hypothetical protein V9K67_17960 [Paraflavisolibacter sp. H34]|uniref:hypothetical protein n=1 Tax=Huijunlia imazamoxiresistens TaxID=3127457 RepID=UPI00301ADDFA